MSFLGDCLNASIVGGVAAAFAVILVPSDGNAAVLNGQFDNGRTQLNFEIRPGESFYNIWDPNEDGDFSDSTTGAEPFFFGSSSDASTALSNLNSSSVYQDQVWSDTLAVDHVVAPFGTRATVEDDFVEAQEDINEDALIDTIQSGDQLPFQTLGQDPGFGSLPAYITFDEVDPIPDPSSIGGSMVLAGFGLFVAYRRMRAAQTSGNQS